MQKVILWEDDLFISSGSFNFFFMKLPNKFDSENKLYRKLLINIEQQVLKDFNINANVRKLLVIVIA